MEGGVALAGIGIASAILYIVVKPLFSLLEESNKRTDANTKALRALVEETRKGNNEAKERNGHLAEIVVNSHKATRAATNEAAKVIVKAIRDVPDQHVGKQTVDEAYIKKEHVAKQEVSE